MMKRASKFDPPKPQRLPPGAIDEMDRRLESMVRGNGESDRANMQQMYYDLRALLDHVRSKYKRPQITLERAIERITELELQVDGLRRREMDWMLNGSETSLAHTDRA